MNNKENNSILAGFVHHYAEMENLRIHYYNLCIVPIRTPNGF